MSRIGRRPIAIPNGVEISLKQNEVTVKGPKGTLTRELHPEMIIKQVGNTVTVERPSDHRLHRALHGTTRSVLANMVTGVHTGFTKSLELVGVGYKATKKGKDVVLNVGYSHPVEIKYEDGIEIEVPAQTQLIVSGIDKERVGLVAANIRSIRKPEPYKGKGIKYSDEKIKRKEGKTGK